MTTITLRSIPVRRSSAPGPHAGLLERGFELRCTTSGPRLAEVVTEYRRLGFEVELVAHRVDADACRACFRAECGDAVSQDVYTRRQAAPMA